MRIVIAEDDVLLREGLILLLTTGGHDVVAIAESGPEIVPAILEHRPDACVIGVRMPPALRDEGLRAAVEVRRLTPGLPVLVLSESVEVAHVTGLVADGVAGVGYLLKDRVVRFEEFRDTLERVASGGTALDPDVVSQLMSRRDGLDDLTPREREVLALTAQGLDDPAIASSLVITERSVGEHLGSVFMKLGIASSDSGSRRVRAVLAYLNS